MDLVTYQQPKMNLATYQQSKLASPERSTRPVCNRCRKSMRTCYCARIRPFSSGPRFVILIHPKESRKRIGSGRLTHLCISNSELIEGVSFDHNARVQAILDDPANFPMVLYPNDSALDITTGAQEKLDSLVPAEKKLVVFVIDGTWSCANKMLKLSTRLRALPQLRFVPPRGSGYQIRRQPASICFSTVEAVHFIIDELKHSRRWHQAPNKSAHENLLEVFSSMVETQLEYEQTSTLSNI